MNCQLSLFAVFLVLPLIAGGCGKNESIEYIQLEEQEIVILKDGRAVASVSPTAEGSQSTILSPDGGTSVTFYTSNSGIASEIKIMHQNATGGTEFLVMEKGDGEVFSDEQFQWIKDAMIDHADLKKKRQNKAEEPMPNPPSD